MDKELKYPKSIVNWPKDERPREKLIKLGADKLSDAELLAILLRTGVKGENALEVARKILQKFKTFQNMGQTDFRDWKEFKGLGTAKIAHIKAAIEIGRRFNSQQENDNRLIIKTTEEAVRLYKPKMVGLKNEVVGVILLSARNRVIDMIKLDEGTPTESHPVIREIVSKTLQNFAAGIICMHNHPAGDSNPTRDDNAFTDELKEACKIMQIKFLDHIIFGEEEYYSFDKRTAQKY